MKICIVRLNVFIDISIILQLLYLCRLNFGVLLLRFKYPTTHKNCKWNVVVSTTFQFLTFTTMFLSKISFSIKKVKRKMLIVVLCLSLYSWFYFFVVYQFFSSVHFWFSSMFSAPRPLTKKTMILNKYCLIFD